MTRILVADDDPECVELLHHALQTPGVELVTARDGGELLELIAEHGPFDLIVTDINMPWMEGVQVLASARAAGLDTPVLVVTGLSRSDLPDTILQLRRAKLLAKPITIAELRSAVDELLRGES